MGVTIEKRIQTLPKDMRRLVYEAYVDKMLPEWRRQWW